MPTVRSPRHGSLQYRPRVRAKKAHARVRSWKECNDGKPLGFAGFKAGMTHILVTDNKKTSPTKGQDINIPVTIIECPPVTIIGIRFYKKNLTGYGETASTEIHFKPTKELARTTKWKESGKLESIKPEEYTRATLILSSNPIKTGFGQKKPHIFEVGFGGNPEQAIAYVKEHKELTAEQVLTAGEYLDTHSVSTGKGTVGPVKRFGIGLRSHKSEKSRRKGVLGPEGYAKTTFHAPQSGKMGYHLRTEFNKQLVGFVTPEEVNPTGGLLHYGLLKNPAILIKGSIPGTKKRLITLTHATRPDPKAHKQAMEITHISKRSQQGNQ